MLVQPTKEVNSRGDLIAAVAETSPETVFQITFCPIGFYRDWRARFPKKVGTFKERREF
jgi:hypothetical protein